MKIPYLLLFFLIQSFVTCSQSDEIYKEIIREYVIPLCPPTLDYSSGKTITILEKPKYLDSLVTEDYSRFKEKYEELQKQTFLDFISVNRLKLNFDTVQMNDIKFIIFNNDSIPTKKDIIARYSDWIFTIIEFSNIGFNKAKNQALVYFGFDAGPGVCGGFYLILEKKRKRWKQKKIVPAWAC